MKNIAVICCAVLTFAFVGRAAFAEDAKLKTTAKAALAKYQDAVVTVKLVVKSRTLADGKEVNKSERPVEITGTVLTPTGLTVISESSIDEMSLSAGEFVALSPSGEAVDAGSVKTERETSRVKLLFTNGREIPGKFVLRDKDLDLAFILPGEKCADMAHIALEKGPVPGVLDDLIVLSRLSKSLNHAPAVSLHPVSAVLKKPRTYLVPDMYDPLKFGCPVFSASGQPVGITVSRRSPKATKNLADMLDDSPDIVVLTAADIHQAASQIAKLSKATK